MMINAQTLCYGIFGYPIRHSLSPVFQSWAFKKKNINAVYIPFEVKPDDLEIATKGAKAMSIKGLNITIPHKEKILDFVDEVSLEVQRIGSCNTLFIEDKIKAYNTDFVGFKKSLEEKTSLKNKKVLVLGAGGTTKAVLYALSLENAEIYLFNRTIEKALELKKVFDIEVIKSPETMIKQVDIIVNTTSVGLKEEDKPLFDYNLIEPHHVVFDVIYKDTPLVKSAKERGAIAINGLNMLIYQGLESFKIWTSVDASSLAEDIKALLNAI